MGNGEIACYLYCLTPSASAVRASAIGVDGRHPVAVRACGQIGAVFSEVELGEFYGETAEAGLQDLAWLGPRVCRHEAVIEEVMRQTPVVPARFATLVTSLDSMQQSVLEHQEAVTGFFARLGDQQEWAVKGLLDRACSLKILSSAEAPVPSAAPGTRYFQEKRIQARVEKEFNLRLKEFCRRAAAALGARPGVFRERKLLAPVAGAEDAEAVLNWAFLVAPAALDDFRMRLERLNGGEAFPGLRLGLTGPWPPYSFAPNLSASEQA
jgi:hypothetical protein